MKSYLLFLFVMVLNFMTYTQGQRSLARKTYIPPIQKNWQRKFVSLISHHDAADKIQSILIGNKKALTKKVRNDFRELGLDHLLTPSGLHLSSLLILFFWIKKRTHRKILLLIIGAPLLLVEGYYSLKRAIIFKMLYFITNIKDLKSCFIATFLIDLILGYYVQSPLSTLFSFAFWGSLIFCPKKSFLNFSISLYISLLIVNLFLEKQTSILIPFINLPLGGFFSLLFPISFLTTILPFSLLSYLNSLLLNLFFAFIQLLATFSYALPHLPAHHFMPIIFLAFFCRSVHAKKILLVTSLTIALPLGENFEHQIPMKKYYYAIPSSCINNQCKNQIVSCKIIFYKGLWLDRCRRRNVKNH